MSFVTCSAKKKKAYQAKYWAANKKRIRRDLRTKLEYRYNALKLRCKRQGVEFKISYKVYIDKMKRNCYYCGLSVLKEIGGGVDRRNNNLRNYTARNLVACCAACNKIKSNVLSWQEMKIGMAAIIKYRNFKKKK